jgi:methylenetetrahydrofolate reductase (NADPH)
MQLNGAASTDSVNGWGPKGGYMYQKGYVEFFCSPETFAQIAQKVATCHTLSLLAANRSGELVTGAAGTTCVTWGAFAQREIMQPLAVTPDTFKAWKDEALELWVSMWGAVAESDAARKLFTDIRDTWFLVSVLENDFVSGNVFRFVS